MTIPDSQPTDWKIIPVEPLSPDWIGTVETLTGLPQPMRGAQLLWQRGLRTAVALQGFLSAKDYQPASPFDFGKEMSLAVARLVKAREAQEKVAIWGDFDADGVTSTAVLWDGLGQFFTDANQLSYFIPNRLKESHGLSLMGLEQLAAAGVTLIVTCDTGSTNPVEIERANALGMDVIVTDHHTLPDERPAVVAIVNPRALPREHAMADLSGVAVAFKLVEAMYERLPEVATKPLRSLTDLVAIGLIADLVELRGDCRYLAQVGIAQLQTHLKALERGQAPLRPGVAKLLQLCRRAGDRPTDISFGIGPRINAVSRIYGDASFCVELLTSQDPVRCRDLAEKAELANARRKALQNDVLQQVIRQIDARDLSTMDVIVLCDALCATRWPVGVLGLVAGQVAQQYGRPTILLTLDEPGTLSRLERRADAVETLARGSARSVNGIDLYELVNSQKHLLSSFGGHPFAAGLSLPASNLPMFTAAINQQYRQQRGGQLSLPTVTADLTVTVAELGRDLFQELKLLEPCGMGNPVPKLLIQNCWFENVWHQKLKDRMGGKVGYIKASFYLCDDSIAGNPRLRFPGLWWGHYKEDLPPGRWDVIAELDYNSHPKRQQYEIRLIDIRPSMGRLSIESIDGKEDPSTLATSSPTQWLLDRRIADHRTAERSISEERYPPRQLAPPAPDLQTPDSQTPDSQTTDLVLDECPSQWKELSMWKHQSEQTHQPVALAYASPEKTNPLYKWEMLLGAAKYLSREQAAVTVERLCEKLEICDRTLLLGLVALQQAGFSVNQSAIDIRFQYAPGEFSSSASGSSASGSGTSGSGDSEDNGKSLSRFLGAIQEENFRRRYFYKAPVTTLEVAIRTEP
ncbi:MAG: single-stranded-DNA-specific exonuclease RecJ [Cyanobacteria bacterium P01_D01_bin.105]